MKIHFIIGTLGGGGAERVMTLLSDYFSQQEMEVSIVTMNNGKDFYAVGQRVSRIRLPSGKFPIVRIRNLISLTQFYRKKENRPDIAISFLTASNIIAILACRINKIPIIVSEHNNHLAVPHPIWLTKFAWRYIYPMANYLTVLTSFDVGYFKSRKSNVVVMPNPCTFQVLEENIFKREKVILAVGNLDRYHHKGWDNLLAIWKPIVGKHPDWKLKIVGGGDKGKEYLQKQLKDLGISTGIEFMGFRNDVVTLMQNSSIFILPSRFEGLPMVLLEAMSQGMACIAYDCITGPGDMIEDRKNGLLIPDQNKQAMENGLLELINNKSLREELGNNARRSLDRYSIESIYSRWKQLINDI